MAGTPEGVFLRSTDKKEKNKISGWKKIAGDIKSKKNVGETPEKKGKGRKGAAE